MMITIRHLVMFLVLTVFGVGVVLAQKAVTDSAQKADGWLPVIELNEINTVTVSYKVEAHAIKLKYDWEYSRHRGSTYVFNDLTFGYNYSYGPAAGTTHNWIPAKALIKGWTRKAAYANGTDDKGRPAKDPIHTAIVTIPIAGGTKGFGTDKKFCWIWTSERYGTRPTIKPDEDIVYKDCTPSEKDDYDSDDRSKINLF